MGLYRGTKPRTQLVPTEATMDSKRRSTRTVSRCILAICLLLLLVSSSIADESSKKKKGILNKILGRFKKKVVTEAADEVEATPVVEESSDEEVCTSDDQTCSVLNKADTYEVPSEDNAAASKVESTNESADNIQNAEAPNDNIESTSNEDSKPPEPAEEETQCIDLHANCATWAAQVDPETNLTPCTTHSAYMQHMCPVSCHTCVLVDIDKQLRKLSKMIGQEGRIHPHCSDEQFDCVTWAKAGECEKNQEYMHIMCRDSCGLCSAKSNYFGSGQRTVNGKSQDLAMTKARIDDTAKYMEMVNTNSDYENVRSRCLNRDKDCSFWFAVGECTINTEFMNMFCAPTCQTCHLLPGFGTE